MPDTTTTDPTPKDQLLALVDDYEQSRADVAAKADADKAAAVAAATATANAAAADTAYKTSQDTSKTAFGALKDYISGLDDLGNEQPTSVVTDPAAPGVDPAATDPAQQVNTTA